MLTYSGWLFQYRSDHSGASPDRKTAYNAGMRSVEASHRLSTRDLDNVIKLSEQAKDDTALDTMAAMADKWCDETNQPDSVCAALYQFTKWARQQHQ
jgi:hypothetical protein